MSPLSFYFLFLVCVFLPWVVWKGLKAAKTGTKSIPKSKILLGTILNLALIGVFGIFVAYRVGLVIFPTWRPTVPEFGVGLFLLAFWFATRLLLLPWLLETRPAHAYKVRPETWADLPLWAAVSVSAGFFEEIVYRGVLFKMLWYWTGSSLVAGGLSAFFFALAHMTQGWRSTLFIFLLALTFQGLVGFTGSLYMAMLVHAVYDLAVGFQCVLRPNPTDEPGPVHV